MYDSKEKYKREWARCADEAVCPKGWISVANLAGLIGCSDASVRLHCGAAGLESRMVRRVTVDGRKLIGRMMVYPKDEALDVMYAWVERREARERRMVEKVERSEAAARRREERAAARCEKEAELKRRERVAREKARVRARRRAARERARARARDVRAK